MKDRVNDVESERLMAFTLSRTGSEKGIKTKSSFQEGEDSMAAGKWSFQYGMIM